MWHACNAHMLPGNDVRPLVHLGASSDLGHQPWVVFSHVSKRAARCRSTIGSSLPKTFSI